MTEYRVPEFSVEQRADAALQMLVPLPERKWGLVSELVQRYGVSRTRLYEIRDQALDAIVATLQPQPAGRPAQTTTLRVDKAFIDRTLVTLPLLKGSVRDIRLGLELILGVTRSVGYISETLAAAGDGATAHNLGIKVPLPILGEADEIFQGRQPCLTLVDGRSFLVLNLTPAASRDGTTWGVTYLDLVQRGIRFQDLACDGGTGLRAGVREAGLAIPLRPDLFHLLQDAQRLTRRLESSAYKALETAERARQADLEQRGLLRRRGPRLKVKVPLPQAEREEATALARCDQWSWLLREVRRTLDPITPAHHLVSVAETQGTVETAVTLLKELGHAGIAAFADDLQAKLPELLAPLEWVEQQLMPVLKSWDANTQAFILWAWQHRQELHLDIDRDIPEHLRAVVRAVWETLGLFHRSSSLAESLHSWLRPYLQIHRGMPKWLLPLLQLFWNHHRFERGKRAGSSPLELAAGTAWLLITAAKTTWMKACSTGVCVVIAGRPGMGRSNKPASPSAWRRSLYTRTERSWVRPAAWANSRCGATSAASRISIAKRRAITASSLSGRLARNLLMPSTTACCSIVKVLFGKSKRTFMCVPRG
jgi:hypothetical protein